MLRGISIALICAAITTACASQAQANVVMELIANGDFETGSLAPWEQDTTTTAAGNVPASSWSIRETAPSGEDRFDAMLNATSNGTTRLWQEFAFPTQIREAKLSWTYQISGAPDNRLSVYFENDNGTRVEDVFSFTTSDEDSSDSGTADFTVTSFAQEYEGQTVRLVFDASHTNDPFNVFIDDVSLAVAVPEPSSLALLGLGLIGTTVGAARRRRKNKLASVLA